MRYSQLFIPTLREAPAEAEVASHVFLIRGGYIRKVAAGIYSLLPLGVRVIQKIERIVREELDRAGAQEVLAPMLHPAELWQESGRWQAYGPELLRIKDRKRAEFAMSPTAEEAIVDLVRRDVRSFRQLPINLYQIQDKFRDEMRPRAGLMRGREFIMKDAYSFHVDEADALREYDNMYQAYTRIFRRCALEFRAVEADTGAIGGNRSHEFQVLADSGEDAIVACDACDYAANTEQADTPAPDGKAPEGGPAIEEVETPNRKTIEEVAAFLGVAPRATVKSVVYKNPMAEKPELAMALVRGDRQLNEVKLKRALGWPAVEMAGEADTKHLAVGFLGPVGASGLRVVADREVAAMGPAVTGANQPDRHFKNALFGRDFTADVVDLRLAVEGDACPRCGEGHYRAFRGIEVGHVFFLGTKYSAPMKCTYLDAAGKEQVMPMGCYGIGITRIAAAAIEQNHDADGIIWPLPIAPFQVEIVAAGKEREVVKTATELEQALQRAGIEVLLDDRDERPGVKFKDADLLGVPIRVTVGKKGMAEGIVEVKRRRGGELEKVKIADAEARVRALVEEGLR